MKRLIWVFCGLVLVLSAFTRSKPIKSYDLIIYGGTSSGVIAAYAAAKEGLKVAILEPNLHLGGLTTSGLGHVDIGNPETVGGYTMEFLKRVGAHYKMNRFCTEMESSAAEKVYLEMMSEAGVDVIYQAKLQEKTGVQKRAGKITALFLSNGDTYGAKMFIDATYEGDLMAWSQVPYRIGRESKEEYNESSAGIQQYKVTGILKPDRINEIRLLGKDFPLDYLFDETATQGGADKKVQAYTYRLSLTTKADNRIPFVKPENYQPERYRDLLNKIHKEKLRTFDQVTTVYPMPNEKADINHLDLVNASWNYADGSYAERDEIANYHKAYQQGYLYFLANDSRVPDELRKDARRYGYPKDEFADHGNWPYLLYVREGRRMSGAYVMKQQDAWDNIHKKDGIAMGSYFMDCHTVQQFITPKGQLVHEGEMEHAPFRPYEIPYAALIPRAADCENLFVTVCLSASHTIYGSLRMEPVFMMTGHAAGVAAAMAIGENITVQQVNTDQLRTKLRTQQQILKYDTKPGFFLNKDSSAYVMDDTDAVFKGEWLHSISSAPFLLYNYRFASQSATQTASATYLPELKEDGMYEVALMYSADKNRSKNALVMIDCDEGRKVVAVDMTRKAPAGYWHTLGEYKFSKQHRPKIVLSNQGNGGVVIADGLRFKKK